MKPLSPELRLVLDAAIPRPGDSARARIRERASVALAWHEVIGAAVTARLAPLVAANLRASGAVLPADVQARFDDEWRSRTTLALAALRQVRDLQRRMATAGITALAYKGPALAVAAYDHVGVRAILDLDFLVPRQALDAARAVMVSAGYRLDLQAHRLFAALPAAAREDHFHPPDPNDFTVEVHVAVVPWALATRFETAALGARAVEIAAGGTTVVTMAPEDHLLVVAAHATHHQWTQVRHVSEMSGLAGRGLDWDAVLARARAARVERMLAVGLTLARNWFDVGLPASVLTWVGREPQARAIAAAIHPFELRAPLARWAAARFAVRHRERLADKTRYVLREQLTSVLEKWPWERWRPPPPHLAWHASRSNGSERLPKAELEDG